MKPKSTTARLALVAVALSAIIISAWLFIPRRLPPSISLGDSWVFRENQSDSIIGDLGGVPVSIPKPYAHFVEYDGDPHFMEKRIGLTPSRTQTSKLTSFGFEIRFPDMAADTEEAKAEKEASTIQTTKWMRVGIASHSAYGAGGDESLEKYTSAITEPGRHRYRYEPLPTETQGLSGFTPVGTDLSRRNLGGGGADMSDQNIYVHRDKNGRVSTYIECGNMTHSADRCKQYFNLKPAMRVRVWVNYRKDLLPQWREIQTSVTKVILGFRVNPPSSNDPK